MTTTPLTSDVSIAVTKYGSARVMARVPAGYVAAITLAPVVKSLDALRAQLEDELGAEVPDWSALADELAVWQHRVAIAEGLIAAKCERLTALSYIMEPPAEHAETFSGSVPVEWALQWLIPALNLSTDNDAA